MLAGRATGRLRLQGARRASFRLDVRDGPIPFVTTRYKPSLTYHLRWQATFALRRVRALKCHFRHVL